jgi:hypothetical protein
MKAIPNIGKMINGFIDDDGSELLNQWDNNAKKFSMSSSDEAREQGFFAPEHILTMAADSFMQLTQQRAIAELPSKLMGTKKKADALFAASQSEAVGNMVFGGASGANTAMRMSKSFNDAQRVLKTASKVSDVVSKVYLTTTAMQDTFNMARQYGFDQEMSSWITLLSMVGMYGLLQTDYFRGLLSNNMEYEARREMKQVTKAFIDTMGPQYKAAGIPTVSAVAADTATDQAKTGFMKSLGKKAKSFFTKHIDKVSSGTFEGIRGIGHGMLAEAAEETMEEVMQDSAIGIVRGFGALAATISGKEYSDSYE